MNRFLDTKTLFNLTARLGDREPKNSAIVQLYEAHNGEWCYTGLQGCMFVTESEKDQTTFFTLSDIDSMEVVWEHEMYIDLQFQSIDEYFYYFEGEYCLYGLNFAEGSNCSLFKTTVDDAVNLLQPKKASKPRSKSYFLSEDKKTNPATSTGLLGGLVSGFKSLLGGSKSSSNASTTTQPKKPKISGAKSFERKMHIGLDSATGGFTVENLPPEWKELLGEMGIDDEQMKNKKVAKQVLTAIAEYSTGSGEAGEETEQSHADVNPPSKPPPPPPLKQPLGVPPPPPPPPPEGLGLGNIQKKPSQTPTKSPRAPPPPVIQTPANPNSFLSDIRGFSKERLNRTGDIPGNIPKAPIGQAKKNFQNTLMKKLESMREHIDPVDVESSDEEW